MHDDMARLARHWPNWFLAVLALTGIFGIQVGSLLFHIGRVHLCQETVSPGVARGLTITPRLTAAMPTRSTETYFQYYGRFSISAILQGNARRPLQCYMRPYGIYSKQMMSKFTILQRRILHNLVLHSEERLTFIQCSRQLDTLTGDASNASNAFIMIAAADVATGDSEGLRLLDMLTRIADADDDVDHHILVDRARSRGLLIARISGLPRTAIWPTSALPQGGDTSASSEVTSP